MMFAMPLVALSTSSDWMGICVPHTSVSLPAVDMKLPAGGPPVNLNTPLSVPQPVPVEDGRVLGLLLTARVAQGHRQLHLGARVDLHAPAATAGKQQARLRL